MAAGDRAPVLLLIGADPRESHRAGEAMRIGLGIVAGENEVIFVLCGPGVHLLDGETDDLVDGDDIARFRASLKALEVPFHVDEGARPSDPGWNAGGHPVVAVSPARIVELTRASRRALIF
jgi:hypothetical protein